MCVEDEHEKTKFFFKIIAANFLSLETKNLKQSLKKFGKKLFDVL